MSESISRRTFLASTTATLAAWSSMGKAAPSERVRVGIIGVGGRGMGLTSLFARNPYVEVVSVADVDSRRIPRAQEIVRRYQPRRPEGTQDFRRIIDDRSIDAVVIATPDHWHAIPTILACMAGKDVYVEKPASHNIVEIERMLAAMKKYGRVIQMGSQHRSTERLKSAIEYARTGTLGRCLFAKGWESARQKSIGYPPDGEPPSGVDYDMWLGPAPKRPFNPNRFHGSWRWFFDYGTGDLGNDGVHRLDMAMAVLEAACEARNEEPLGWPVRIHGGGGKWYFDDMQEFPDTMQVTYQFEGPHPRLVTYELRIWTPYTMEQETEGAAVYGDEGYMIIGNNRWRAYTRDNRLVKEVKGDSNAAPHVQDFIDCIKTRNRPACDLETVGARATVMCHAGNISARLGRSLLFDRKTLSFVDDREANRLRDREEWRKPWTLPEV